jgi:tetratricopeptide (TPR) repeat protein
LYAGHGSHSSHASHSSHVSHSSHYSSSSGGSYSSPVYPYPSSSSNYVSPPSTPQIPAKDKLAKDFSDLGYKYYYEKDYQKAAESFENAVELKPLNSDYHHSLGLVYTYLNKFDASLKHLKKAQELIPDLPKNKADKEKLKQEIQYVEKLSKENQPLKIEEQINTNTQAE